MRSIKILCARVLLFFVTICWSGSIAAQEINNVAPTSVPGYNLARILMVIIALVLAFVIYGMGQVLTTLAKQAMDKISKNSKVLPIVLLIGSAVFTQVSFAQEIPVANVVQKAANYGGMDSTSFWALAAIILLEVAVIGFILFSIGRIQAELAPEKQPAKPLKIKEWWKALDKKLFTKAIAVEEEQDILLDHDYDGIRELDNSLPPWWKYGFIITVLIAVAYLLHFHVLGSGKNPTQEYQEELVMAEESKLIYEAKNKDKIDESNLQMPQLGGLEAGKKIYNALCWTCHGKAGEGGAGPNLTDDYWLHKGSLTDIYLSIKHGYPEKGMQAWEKQYSPKEINNIAGYIKTLRGTNPPGARPAQGDLFVENSSDSSLVTLDKK